jgi:uncharacterized protein (DUF1697 family)
MAKRIALLRGVNVGGKTVKMDQLRLSCAVLGLKNVQTYVQSGNVIFESGGPSAALVRKLETRLLADFGLPVSVILRSAADLAKVLDTNPFLTEIPDIDRSKLHVTFLSQEPAPGGLEKLAAIKAAPDQMRASGLEIYLHCPSGYGGTKLSNNTIERALAVRATTRNWNTVNKLYELVSGEWSQNPKASRRA